MKVLITGGRSATALKLLKAFSADDVILADYGDMPTFTSATYKFISLGQKNEDTLAHTLLNHCLDHQIEVILPLHSFEIDPIAKAGILFNEFNVYVVLPQINTCEHYLHQGLTSRSNWVIYKFGKVIYTTQEEEQIYIYGKNSELNGAFYFEIRDGKLRLALITI